MSAARSPLYLDVLRTDRVSLEAPALRVVTQTQAEVFYPLRRLSRVVVTGQVEWETRALLACLEYGVPVAFRQRNGELIGHCLSQRTSCVSLESLLQSSAEQEAGESLYRHWLEAAERQTILRIARRTGLYFSDLGLRAVERSLLPAVVAVLPCPLGQFRALLQAPLESHLAEVLSAYGFSDNIHLPLTPRMHLSRDLARVLWWEIWLQVLTQPAPVWEKERGLRFSLVQYYQYQAGYLEERARVHLNRLWRVLKQQEVD